MVKAASCIMGLGLRVPTRGSTALTLIGSRHAEARSRGLLQRALLREVSRMTTSVTSTTLAVVIGVESVAVTSGGISTGWAVAGVLTAWVVGPRGLRGEPLWWWRSSGWGQAAGPVTTRSSLIHHPPFATLAGSFVLVFDHYGSIYHGLQVRIVNSHKVSLQLLL
jgi:hypothetical protein